MVKSKDEILEILKTRIGEEPDDDSIKLLEDVTDTFADFEEKLAGSEDWKAKYEENDKEWRKKYTDRFFSGSDDKETPDPDPEDPPEKHEPMSFEDLFKTEE